MGRWDVGGYNRILSFSICDALDGASPSFTIKEHFLNRHDAVSPPRQHRFPLPSLFLSLILLGGCYFTTTRNQEESSCFSALQRPTHERLLNCSFHPSSTFCRLNSDAICSDTKPWNRNQSDIKRAVRIEGKRVRYGRVLRADEWFVNQPVGCY